MLRTHLRIAARTLRARPGTTAINLIGLTLGLTVCFLIGLYVRHERSYDHFHANADRLSRVVVDMNGRNGAQKMAVTQGVLAPTILQDVGTVEHVIRVDPQGESIFQIGDRFVRERDVIAADSAFFQAFSFDLQRGDPVSALTAPGSVVLTESAARRLFADADPMGQMLRWNERETLTVTGVAADPPSPSHVSFSAVIALSTLERARPDAFTNWMGFRLYTYVLQRPGTSRETVQAGITGLMERYAKAELDEDGMQVAYRLEPVADVRLRSAYGGIGATGQSALMLLFAGIGVFVLAVACINFVNLATARATERAREVGVRKTLGAGQAALARQFLTESVLLASAATGLAVLLTAAVLPAFEQLAGQPIRAALSAGDVALLVGVAIGVGLLAGSYPAWVLSRFPPARILRSNTSAPGDGGLWVRRGLVVGQFAVSISLIAATAITLSQMQYLQTRHLGLDFGDGVRTHVLAIPFGRDAQVQASLPALRDEFLAIPGVTGVSASFKTPGENRQAVGAGTVQGAGGREERATLHLLAADPVFADIYDLALVAGHGITDAPTTDSTGVYVLNETAVRRIGYASPEDALGKTADFWGVRGPIVGVVRDFHTEGLQAPVPALALVSAPDNLYTLSVRIEAADVQRVVGAVEARWEAVVPHQPFAYRFVDAQFDAQYRAEQRFSRLFGLAALLSLLIAGLGLLGLAAYAVQRRTKEIGVRRVMGASVPSIVRLLSSDFAVLVGVAFAMAAPVTYLAMQRWLDGFAYRIDLGPSLFLIAGAVVLVLAIVVVGAQAWRAARLAPTTALRSE